ncbi:hypothetical protein G6O69_03625 [Pseudenhygromyxa sp. WMMC2535]|uniref:hypothetical protein n=1 Tax=Pseudenhygromyxa sp. WMMC2535 TaxID=2712867 RepID=UPI001556BC9B|nr:hypothetical protein [Pseudenhygromyxa sp. WMMC2535]NVB36905.1 hypothetical protein [Pseudenhygromyxa sp. WMMC2535]
MQRLPAASLVVLLTSLLAAAPACKGDRANDNATGDKPDSPAAEAGEGAPTAEAGAAEAGAAEAGAAEAGEAEAGAAEAGAEAGEAAAETSTGGTGAEDTTGAAEAGATETGEADPAQALLESVKTLDTEDDAAKKALGDAVAAGASKLDAAKIANERGEALLTKGESERAEVFFVWASEAHKLYAEPVFNLAKLDAYAGDLEAAKEHLVELEKRGNKKLMKKVGVDPAFTPLLDDADVRKIYEVQ